LTSMREKCTAEAAVSGLAGLRECVASGGPFREKFTF
jgi:hypothetical protein